MGKENSKSFQRHGNDEEKRPEDGEAEEDEDEKKRVYDDRVGKGIRDHLYCDRDRRGWRPSIFLHTLVNLPLSSINASPIS
jgi:hypothetical protein